MIEDQPPILDYAPPKPIIPPWVFLWAKRLVWAVTIPALLLVAARLVMGWFYPPIPIKMVSYSVDDTIKWGNEVTIYVQAYDMKTNRYSPLFRITFEGRSFHAGWGGYCVVEGRELGLMPWSLSYYEEQKDFVGCPGITLRPSSRTHTIAMDYVGKHFVFSDPDLTLSADGVSYSMAHGPIYLRVTQAGEVVPQKIPLKSNHPL